VPPPKAKSIRGDLFDQETFAGRARALGLYESIASYDLALKYAPMVRSLTAADIMEVAAEYFGANNYCLARIEPKSVNK
jgi:predicted Zn-dependent peptidase